jgi:hypothetical protein
MQVTVHKLQTIHQKVKYCLERYPETRNSDIDLFARLCENFYPPFERPLYGWRDLAGAMHSVPSLDHIARCRRKVIQESNYKKYLPTDEYIALGRGYARNTWKQYAISHNIPELPKASNIPIGYNDDGQYIGQADIRTQERLI